MTDAQQNMEQEKPVMDLASEYGGMLRNTPVGDSTTQAMYDALKHAAFEHDLIKCVDGEPENFMEPAIKQVARDSVKKNIKYNADTLFVEVYKAIGSALPNHNPSDMTLNPQEESKPSPRTVLDVIREQGARLRSH